jgi:hypothetical protein
MNSYVVKWIIFFILFIEMSNKEDENIKVKLELFEEYKNKYIISNNAFIEINRIMLGLDEKENTPEEKLKLIEQLLIKRGEECFPGTYNLVYKY